MAESSSVTELTEALTLQGSCQAADNLYGVTSSDKMADGEFLQGATKETRNGDVHKNEVEGGFEFDNKPSDRFSDDQKVPTGFCAEDSFQGDAPSYPAAREPEIPLGSDAASFPPQCEDFVGSNIDDSFSPFNSEISSYSQTGSHESFSAFGGDQEMEPTPEALPDPVPPMAQKNELIDFSKDEDQAADLGFVSSNPFGNPATGQTHQSDPYSQFQPPDMGSKKTEQQSIQSPLHYDAPEFYPQQHSNADYSPLRHDAPEFVSRASQQAAMFDQTGLQGNELPQYSQLDTSKTPAQDAVDSKETVPTSMEGWNVPVANMQTEQADDYVDDDDEEDYSESESNSQVENDEIIEDDYTDSEEDTENLQDEVVCGAGEMGQPADVHPEFDPSSIKQAFNENNELDFQQQIGSSMPSAGADPPLAEGFTEQGQKDQIDTREKVNLQNPVENQQETSGDLSRDTLSKSETFTIESDSDMEKRSITPVEENMVADTEGAASDQNVSGYQDNLTNEEFGGAAPPFGQNEIEQTTSPMQKQENSFASDMEACPAAFHGDENDMFTKSPAIPQEAEKEQVTYQDEKMPPLEQGFNNETRPNEVYSEEPPMFIQQGISSLEQPGHSDDVASPRDVLLEETSKQELQMDESVVDDDKAMALDEPARQQDIPQNTVFTQQNQEYEDEGEDEGTYPDDQNSEDQEDFIDDDDEEEEYVGRSSEERDEYVQGQKSSSEERDEYVQGQKLSSEERDEYLQEQKLSSEERDEYLQEQKLSSEERDEYLQEQKLSSEERDEYLQEQKLASDERDEYPQEQKLASEERDEYLQEQKLPSEERDEYPQEQKLPSEERSVSPHKGRMSVEKEFSPEVGFASGEKPVSAQQNTNEIQENVTPELKDSFASDAKMMSASESQPVYGQHPFEEQGAFDEKQPVSQTFEEDSIPMEHEMVPGRSEQTTSDELFGAAPAPSEQGGVLHPDQGLGQEADTFRDEQAAVIPSEGSQQRQDILTAEGDFDQGREYDQRCDISTAAGVDDFDKNEQKSDILTSGGVNGSDQPAPDKFDDEDVAVQQNVTDEYPQQTDDFAQQNITDDFAQQNVEDDFARQNVEDDFARQNITDEFAQQNITNDFQQQNVEDNFAQQNITDDFAQQNITDDFAQQNFTNDFQQQNVQDDFPQKENTDEFAQQNITNLLQQNDTNDFKQKNVKDDFPQQNVKDDFPQQNVKDDFPQQNVEDDFPQQNVKDDFPQQNVKDDFPQQNVEDDFPKQMTESDYQKPETVTHDIYKEQKEELLEAVSDVRETCMLESDSTAGSLKTYNQSEVPAQMADLDKPMNESMQGSIYKEDDASLNESSMVLKETESIPSSLSQSTALEEHTQDLREDGEKRLKELAESAKVDQQMAPEDVAIKEEAVSHKENTVAPEPELPKPTTAQQQVMEQSITTSVPEPSIAEKVTEKTEEKLPEKSDKVTKGKSAEKVAKKIAEPAEKKTPATDKSDKKDAKVKKTEKPTAKTPQKPLRKPKEKTPPKSEPSKIPSPTKTENRIPKSTTRTARPAKTASPRTLDVKPSTDKPPFDTSFPRAVSASSQRIAPLSQTPTTPSPTKVTSKKLPTRTQTKEATESFLERMSRPRCRTPKKDGTSDSGFEENKTQRAASATSQRKKYGIDAKNDNYKPGGGNVKITDQKVTVKHVGSRIDARSKTPTSTNRDHTPRTTPKGPTPDTKHVQSKIGSLANATHTPGGGNVRIANQKKDYSAVQGKIGSKVNLDHRPKGGDKKIMSQKLEWKAASRVGSLDNAKHSPGGGKVKITNEKVAWKRESRIGSLDNVKHEPGGGNVKIETAKLDFKEKAASKVGSKDNMDHKAGGGDKKIETKKLDFKEKATSKVGSKDNATHKPGGGDKKRRGSERDIKMETTTKKRGPRDKSNWVHLPSIDMGYRGKPKVNSMSNTQYQPKQSYKEVPSFPVIWKSEAKVKSIDPEHIERTKKKQRDWNDTQHTKTIVLPKTHASRVKDKWEGACENSVTGKLEIPVTPKKFVGKPKVGSLENAGYKPGGGNVEIPDERPQWDSSSKVGSLLNIHYMPKTGYVEISNKKFNWNVESKVGSFDNIGYVPTKKRKKAIEYPVKWEASSKVGSLDNKNYQPGGGNVQVLTEKKKWNGQSKVGSLQNIGYQSGGGNVEYKTMPLNWKAESKVGSLVNKTHKPKGGNKTYHTEELVWDVSPKVGSLVNKNFQPGGGNVTYKTEELEWKASPKVGSLENRDHTPGGGNKTYRSEELDWKASPKVGSLVNKHYQPRGGNKEYASEELNWKAEPKVGSLLHKNYQAGGGNFQVVTEKLPWNEIVAESMETGQDSEPANQTEQTQVSEESSGEVSLDQESGQ